MYAYGEGGGPQDQQLYFGGYIMPPSINIDQYLE